MKRITTATAKRLREEGMWRGTIIFENERPYTGLSLNEFSRYMKKFLRTRYPLAKNSIRLQRSKNNSRKFIFIIKFTDDAEEAEFIMTISTLEGTVL